MGISRRGSHAQFKWRSPPLLGADYFLTLALAQMTFRESLRDVAGLDIPRLSYHVGFVA